MKKIKKSIVYLGFNNPLIYKRGVENVILFQSHSLGRDISKYYIFFGDKDENFMWEDINCISIKKDFFRFFKLNRKINELCKNEKMVIHSHNYLMSFFLWWKTDVFTVHDGLYYLSFQRRHRLTSFFRYIEKTVYKKSAIVHFISGFAKKESLYPVSGKNFEVIYNTTPMEKLKMKRKKSETEVDLWSLDKIKIFSVRSMEERANIELLIELAQRNSSYEIKVAGKGPLLEHYRKEVKDKNLYNMEFMGYISDEKIAEYYSGCDIVLVPAKYGEGFGLPVIEGYLYNKPVFASNVCAIPEIILSPEIFLVQNSADSLDEKIKSYLKENRKYEFRGYYENNFSYNRIIKKYRKMYENIIIQDGKKE